MEKKLLRELKKELRIVEKRIDSMQLREDALQGRDDLILKPSCRPNGRNYYNVKQPGNHPLRYLGSDSHPEVQMIREAHFARKYIAEATEYADKLRELIAADRPLDYNSINQALPAVYRGASLKYRADKADDRAITWLDVKRAEKKAMLQKYPDKYADNLIHTAMDGEKYRSKSETDIADALFLCGIPYIYELPVILNGKLYRFDFRCLSLVDCESEIIIEHQGMMDEPAYQDKYMNTLTTCLKNGIIPNVDIFFTFDDMFGRADTRQIKFIIDSVLLPG